MKSRSFTVDIPSMAFGMLTIAIPMFLNASDWSDLSELIATTQGATAGGLGALVLYCVKLYLERKEITESAIVRIIDGKIEKKRDE